jgi:hypothetical protein
MDHSLAKTIFEEIRERPYSVSESADSVCNNCYYKGMELLQRLGALGYIVRGRLGETYWDSKIIPQEIVDLYPTEFPCLHFFVEINDNEIWRYLDPSIESGLAKYGFPVADWDGSNAPCFPITKLYSQEEVLRFFKTWEDPAYVSAYFDRASPFFIRFNQWLNDIRS